MQARDRAAGALLVAQQRHDRAEPVEEVAEDAELRVGDRSAVPHESGHGRS